MRKTRIRLKFDSALYSTLLEARMIKSPATGGRTLALKGMCNSPTTILALHISTVAAFQNQTLADEHGSGSVAVGVTTLERHSSTPVNPSPLIIHVHLPMGSPSTLSSPTQNASVAKSGVPFARQDHPRYRTKRCKHDLRGNCPFGDSCSYIHGSRPLFVPPPTAVPPYTSNTPVSSVLQDALLQPMSPYTFTTVHRTFDEPDIATPFTPYQSPTLPADVDEAFRSLSISNAAQRQRRNASSVGRACHYRTKPCRFFHTNGRCAKGDRCNFIHDHSAISAALETETDSSFDILDTSSESGQSSCAKGQSIERSDTPAKKSSGIEADSQERTNFYPITWRVIGGGVMMSGPREPCQDYMAGRCSEGLDCKYSHPAAADEEGPVAISETLVNPYYAGGISPTSPVQFLPVPHIMLQPPPRRELRRPSSRAQARRALRSKQDEQDADKILDGSTLLPMQPSDDVSSEDKMQPRAPPALAIARKFDLQSIPRPLSTPPSTTSSGFKIVRLFSAESP